MVREDPIGSAAMHERYLFVEVPVPWDYDVKASKHFPKGFIEVLKRAAENEQDFRFLSFVSDAHPSPAGYRRVMYYQKPSSPFAGYEKKEYVVPAAELNVLAEALLNGSEPMDRFEPYAFDGDHVRDLFVCTHGSHDVCCGKFGYPMYKILEENYAAKSSGKLRVWRVSHFGGHRHAPTIADLPEGRYWAQVEPEDLDTLVLRQGPFAHISRKYRGWGGIGKYEQMVEREIFIREGWSWIDYNKKGTVLKEEGHSMVVRIDYSSADGAVSGTYEGTVVPTGSVKMGGCGSEVKDVQQYNVLNVMKL
nr:MULTISPECIES: sucrase ferredoxin [unclassified Paenibacillus]